MEFSLDSEWLVSASHGEPCTVVVWDVASLYPVAVGHTDHVCKGLLFLKDCLDPRFVVVSSKHLILWDLQVNGLHRSVIAAELDSEDCISCGFADAVGRVYAATSMGHLFLLEVKVSFKTGICNVFLQSRMERCRFTRLTLPIPR